ncbi:tandem-95 repeat protein [Rhizobium sp. RHZ02]|uniref:VCBS domain-containing protein n=1 Tax=Rhizobium sp. RHZ02 TaxID=2769306 RepID=UPI00177BB56D|nr:VCBS domain-containing protein [Rhizobium sp. RHZ02]MBD9452227.1 tandem-95 repeat protein [Rhizobium sp. RHZ02]
MSIEDPRISAAASENVSHDFRQDIHEDASIETSARQGVEFAQADNSQQPEKTDRVPAAPQTVAANTHPAEIVPDQNNVAHLPADVSIDDIRVEGNNLVLIQADGTEIVIVNGALHVPTFLIGDVALPQQAVLAALEQSHINVAAGPDGSYSASASPSSSGAEFQDTFQQDSGEPTQLAALLGDSELLDGAGPDSGDEGFNHAPTLEEIAPLSFQDTRNDDTFSPISGQLPGFDQDRNDALIYSVAGGASSDAMEGYDTVKVGFYGTLYLNSITGAYTYVPDDTAVEGLKTTEQDVFSFTVADKAGPSAPQTLTINVKGVNDTPELSATLTGHAYNDTVADDTFTAVSGKLLTADRDLNDSATYGITGGSSSGAKEGFDTIKVGSYGSLFLNSATGAYTYVPNDAAVEGLKTHSQESFTLTVTDGSNATHSQTLTIDLNGMNDTATISGSAAGDVVEDGKAPILSEDKVGGEGTDKLHAEGQLIVSDRDADDNHFQTPASEDLNGKYGTFTFDPTSGKWTYALNNESVQSLAAGQAVHDSLSITSADGTASQTIDVTITGTNDAPVIDADVSAIVSEQMEKLASLSFDTAKLTIGFTDVDLNNTGHTAQVVGVSTSGVPSGLLGIPLSDKALLSYLHIDGVAKADDSDRGEVTATFKAPDLAFDYLGVGDSLTLTYTVQVSDGAGGVSTQTVNVVVTGTNDAPIVSAGLFDLGATGAINEQKNQTGSSTQDQAKGTLAFWDADLSDVQHNATVTHVEVSGVKTGLSQTPDDLIKLLETTVHNNTNAGTVDWTFTAVDKTFDYLAAGEKLTLTYTVEVSDAHGGLDTQAVKVTITGSNDRPVITVGDGDSIAAPTIKEANLSTGSDTLLCGQGTLSVTDADWTDTHKVSSSYASAVWSNGTIVPTATVDAIKTAFAASLTTDAGNGGIGKIGWSFDLADKYTDFLAKDETLTLTYQVAVKDDSSAANNGATQTVVISITGTNDAPVLSADTGSHSVSDVSETIDAALDAGPRTTSGALTFTDVDLTDRPTASYAFKTITTTGVTLSSEQEVALKAAFTAGAAAGNTNNGTVNWNYSIAESALDFLAKGQHVQLTYTITVDDGHGGVASRDVSVTVNGANDAPVAIADSNGSDIVKEAGVLTDGDNRATGNVLTNDTDVDTSDTKSVSALAGGSNFLGVFSKEGVYGTLTLGANGEYRYDLRNLDSDTNQLKEGEKVADTFTYTVKDANGLTSQTTLTINILGTNDAPVARSQFSSVSEGTTAAATTVTGSLLDGASDVDHDAALRIANVDNHIDGGAGVAGDYGTLTWDTQTGAYSYALDNAKPSVQALAQGEVRLETFTFTVTDENGATSTRTLTVTITGTNDAPGPQAQFNSVTEDTQPSTVTANLLQGATDDHFSVMTIANVGGSSNGLSGVNGTYGKLTWSALTGGYSYKLDNANPAVQAIALDETKTETFTFTVRDQYGAISTQTLSIDVHGTNDGVTFVSAGSILAGGVVEDGQQQATGTINFNDVDLIDTHTATVTNPTGPLLGTFALAQVSESPTTAGGSLGWTYTIDNTAAQSLGEGITRKETYSVTIIDAHGGLITKDVVVTITGTNDAPVLSADTGSHSVSDVSETIDAALDAGPRTTSGALTFTDVDLTDRPTASYAFKTITTTGVTLSSEQEVALKAAFTAGAAAGNTNNGTVNWNYSIAESALDFLAKGQHVQLTYTITVDDGHGGVASRDVSVTVNGANDAPVAIADSNGSDIVKEAGVLTDGDNRATGNVLTNDTDVDTSDTKSVSALAGGSNFLGVFSKEGVYGTLTLGANGEYRYDLRNLDSDTNQLKEGEKVADTFTYTVKDANGLTSQTTLTINILGTNDAPVARSQFSSVSEGTTAAATTVTGSLLDGASDVDHDAALRIANVDNHIDGGAGVAGDYGTLTWDTQTGAYSYALDNAKPSVQALAQGEVRLETFTFTVTDENGATSTRTLTVTITGTNDAPVPQAQFNSVTEDTQPSTVTGNLLQGATDDHFSVMTIANVGGSSNGLSGVNGTYGKLTWSALTGGYSYKLDNANPAVQAIALDETKTETFTFTVRDQYGAISTQTLSIDVHGTNDGVTFVSAGSILAGGVVEDGQQQATGTINFNDVDLIDTHTATVTNPTGPLLGTFALAQVSESPTTAGGSLGWTYTIDNTAAQSLGEGITRKETYSVTIIDAHGGLITKDVVVTITGTNDAPVITIPAGTPVSTVIPGHVGQTLVTDGVTEGNSGGLTTHGTLIVSDVDHGDIVKAQVLAVDGGGSGFTAAQLNALGFLSVSPGAPSAVLDGTQTSNSLTWNFNSGSQTFDFLPQGWEVRLNYTIRVTDSHGATADQIVSIVVHGTNDAPVISAPLANAVTEAGTLADHTVVGGIPSVGGTLLEHATDVDSPKLHIGGVSFNGGIVETDGSIDGLYGRLTWNSATGVYTYELDNQRPATQALNAGDQVTETFSYTVSDGAAATAGQLTITVNGANDDPIAKADTFGSVPNGWTLNEANGHIYTFAPTVNDETWAQARIDAAALLSNHASYLATITNAGEQNVVLGIVNGNAIAYLGGTDAANEGHWVWATGPEAGQPFTYTHWEPGEPNSNGDEDVLWIYGQFRDGQWNDGPTNTGLTFGGYQFGYVAEAGEPGSHYAAINEDAAYSINASLLLENDQKVDSGDVLSVIGFDETGTKTATSAMHASVSFDGTSFKYDPTGSAQLQHLAAGEKATDTFSYTISDGQGHFSTATVTITITGTNDTPVLTADAASLTETSASDAGHEVLAGVVLSNDTDAESDALSVITIRPFSPNPVAFSPVSADGATTVHGTYGDLVMHSDGSYSYVANAAYDALTEGQVVSDVFKYGVSDGHGGAIGSLLTITITGTNDTPVLTADAASLTETSASDAGHEVLAGVVLSNDTDAEGDALSVITIRPFSPNPVAFSPVSADGATTVHGTYGDLVMHSDGSYSYVANAAYDALTEGQVVSDVFKYGVSDGHGGAIGSLLTITITGTNDTPVLTADLPPSVTDDTVTVITNKKNQDLVISHAALLWNASDPEGHALAVTSVGGSDKVEAGNNSVTFHITGSSNSFTYDVSDGTLSDHVTATVMTNVDSNNLRGSDNNTDIIIADGSGSHSLYGLGGNDVLVSSGGNDHLDGGAGDDLLIAHTRGSITAVSMDGGDGNDTFVIDQTGGPINLDGGSGNDSLDLSHLGAGLNVSLNENGHGTFAQGGGYTGIENLIGTHYADTLTGNALANILDGRDGNDYLQGGAGKDTVTGGGGADTFVLDVDALSNLNMADVITDFSKTDGDSLDVSKLLSSILGHTATATEAQAMVQATVSNGNTVISISDNANGAGALHQVATLQGYVASATSTVKILFDDDHTHAANAHLNS